jgi:hypothetical protein
VVSLVPEQTCMVTERNAGLENWDRDGRYILTTWFLCASESSVEPAWSFLSQKGKHAAECLADGQWTVWSQCTLCAGMGSLSRALVQMWLFATLAVDGPRA